jgi:hypothetical protein
MLAADHDGRAMVEAAESAAAAWLGAATTAAAMTEVASDKSPKDSMAMAAVVRTQAASDPGADCDDDRK